MLATAGGVFGVASIEAGGAVWRDARGGGAAKQFNDRRKNIAFPLGARSTPQIKV